MFKDFLYEVPSFLVNSVRNVVSEHEEQAVRFETIESIQKATLAMCEAKIKDDMIIAMLQKYWDLRLSEATEFLSGAKDYLNKK